MDYVKNYFIRINQTMQERGFTLKQLAELTGIPIKSLQRYTVDVVPKARALCKICTALHVSADYLLSIGEHND